MPILIFVFRTAGKTSTFKFATNPERRNSPESLQVGNTVSDSLRTYCTEDTPAGLSRAGSNSDLSVLSLAGTDKFFSQTDGNTGQDCQIDR